MPRAVIFDVGGVLLAKTAPAEQTGRLAWCDRFGMSLEDFCGEVWSAIGSEGERGTAEILARLTKAFGVDTGEARTLLVDFHAHWRPEPTLLEYARRLRGQLKIGVLANAGAATRWAFESILQLHRLADDIVISAEVGLEKPEPAIFRLAANRLRCTLAECVFVDDLVENVEAAKALGMTGILHESPSATLEALAVATAVRR